MMLGFGMAQRPLLADEHHLPPAIIPGCVCSYATSLPDLPVSHVSVCRCGACTSPKRGAQCKCYPESKQICKPIPKIKSASCGRTSAWQQPRSSPSRL